MKNSETRGCCLYRLPGAVNIIRIEGTVGKFKNDFPERGFVLAPFDREEQSLLMKISKESTLTLDEVEQFDLKSDNHSLSFSNPIQSNSTKESYLDITQKALDAIAKDKLKKVVTARFENMLFNEIRSGFNVIHYFSLLCRHYPNMFVYLWHNPKGQTWMGATPELLLSQNGESAQTVALAGTKPLKSGRGFTLKEAEEQQWVLRFLKETLEEAGVRDIEILKTHELEAGHLKHLVTPVSFSLNSSDDRWKLLSMLHPTPAVCGYPMNTAQQFIKDNESFERGFYSGFLGPCDRDTMTLFVNIRCMQVHSASLTLYAGAGITGLSNPEEEWEETERKLDTLKSLLKK